LTKGVRKDSPKTKKNQHVLHRRSKKKGEKKTGEQDGCVDKLARKKKVRLETRQKKAEGQEKTYNSQGKTKEGINRNPKEK